VRRVARVDANQTEIVRALRETGQSVLLLHQVGGGCPDILSSGVRACSHCGHNVVGNFLIEIKDGSKLPNKQKLTPDEQAFFDGWRGQVEIARSIEEALRIVGRLPAI
jgi:hypothetical protein